ncbi:MAG TPA: PilX N-terminal domain-containing pilus assembly protein [Vicinamibacterales bacterium]
MRHSNQQGMALMTTLLVTLLMSAIMLGFAATIMSDQKATSADRDQTQAYAAAHAGLEKLTSDLADLFRSDFSPNAAQVAALTTTPPSLTGFMYQAPDGSSGYTITFNQDGSGNPAPADPNGTSIPSGPFQGFSGIITPYDITVTARSTNPTGAEVRLRRTLQTVAIPVFQFGLFSETDLSFFAGPDFNFGGRVHSNASIFLAEGDGNDLTLSDRVTAVGEVIRTHLSNGWPTSSSYNGNVRVLRAPNTFRNLAQNEGSLVGTLGSAENEPKWTSLSVGTYASNIRNGRTGARRLDLPLVSQGAAPIDLIRRPPANEHVTTSQVYRQRFFAQAGIRILLSDTAEDLTKLPTVTATPPVALGNLTTTPVAGYVPGGSVAPFALSGGTGGGVYTSAAGTPLLGGFIKIEIQTQAGTWQDVTLEILNLGTTGRKLSTNTLNVPAGTGGSNPCPNEPHPDAVIRIQRVRDVPAAAGFTPCGTNGSGHLSPGATDYWPLALYDTREGNLRDTVSTSSTQIALGGIVHYIELDVNNLRRWVTGAIGASGGSVRDDNGFIVYFSDRRNNRDASGQETGEYGFEDFVNPSIAAGTPNSILETGEDVNANGVLDVYGRNPVNVPAGALAPFDGSARPWTTTTSATVARANRHVLFRRALKITNGGLGNIVAPGLTVASENPVYVQGNYNAAATDVTAEPNVACAIIADAVTLLSNGWNDIRSFIQPNNPGGRAASTTGYRMAIISGKNLSFPRPTSWSPYQDFGTDGGAHNFLRYLEGWSGSSLNYRGSLVSFFISRQATGTYKCCTNVYNAPTRGYNFDVDFLLPSLLPPGTPMFRDVNTLTFRQLLRPNQ